MAKATDTAAPAVEAPVAAPAPVVAPVTPGAADVAAAGPVPASVAIAAGPGTVEYIGQGGIKLTVQTN